MTITEHTHNTQAIANQLERGPLQGTCSTTGAAVDNRGKLAMLKASLEGVTDPDELRAISRAAKA